MHSVVQGFWSGSRLPAIQCLSIRSFLANGHPFHLYAYDEIENLPAGAVQLDAETVVPRANVFTYQHGFGKGSVAGFSDVFRYTLLFANGGWWVDTDVVCLKPFDTGSDHLFATERQPDGQVTAATCVIRAPAGAGFLRYCLDVCDRVDKTALEWGGIGPKLLQDALTRFGLTNHAVAPDVFAPIDYFRFEELVSPGFQLDRISNSLAVHLWNQKWTTHYLDPDYDGPPDSLYALLRRRYLPPTTESSSAAAAHEAFQRTTIKILLGERDDAQYALEREHRNLQAAWSDYEKLQHTLAESERERADSEQKLADAEGSRALLSKEYEHLKLTLAGLQTENAELRAAIEETRSALQVARGEARALRSSLSWRLASPLRFIYDAIVSAARLFRRVG